MNFNLDSRANFFQTRDLLNESGSLVSLTCKKMDFNVNDKDEIDFNTQSVISFFCGNPIVELTRGEIHLLQPAAQSTNLKKSKIVATLAGINLIDSLSLFLTPQCPPI